MGNPVHADPLVRAYPEVVPFVFHLIDLHDLSFWEFKVFIHSELKFFKSPNGREFSSIVKR